MTEKRITKETQRTCVLCGCRIVGYGCNPDPLSAEGECCEHCDEEFVIPARIAMHYRKDWATMKADLRNTAWAEGCLVRLQMAIDQPHTEADWPTTKNALEEALHGLCDSVNVDYETICKRAKE